MRGCGVRNFEITADVSGVYAPWANFQTRPVRATAEQSSVSKYQLIQRHEDISRSMSPVTDYKEA